MVFEGVKQTLPSPQRPKLAQFTNVFMETAQRIEDMTGVPLKYAVATLRALHNIECQDWLDKNLLYHPVLGCIYIREKRRIGRWNQKLQAVEKDVEYINQKIMTYVSIPGSFERAKRGAVRFKFDKSKFAPKPAKKKR